MWPYIYIYVCEAAALFSLSPAEDGGYIQLVHSSASLPKP